MINKKVIIVAEAGINHNGSIENAKKLIEKASMSGADYIKFQTYDTDSLVTKKASSNCTFIKVYARNKL